MIEGAKKLRFIKRKKQIVSFLLSELIPRELHSPVQLLKASSFQSSDLLLAVRFRPFAAVYFIS